MSRLKQYLESDINLHFKITTIQDVYLQKDIVECTCRTCETKYFKTVRKLAFGCTCNNCNQVKTFTSEYLSGLHNKISVALDVEGLLTKIECLCEKHGKFIATVKQLKNRKYGCKKCATEIRLSECPPPKIYNLHNKTYLDNLYENTTVEEGLYSFSYNRIRFNCAKHGDQESTVREFLMRNLGCIHCGLEEKHLVSKSEIELHVFVNSLVPTITNTRDIIHPKELDIYIEEKKIAIEFNGIYWHSSKFKDKNYHLNKTELCHAKGILLVHVYEDEWKHKQDIVKSMIRELLEEPTSVITTTDIRNVGSKESKEFLIKNHLQGNARSSIRLGMFIEDTPVSLMTFSKIRNSSNYELTRFCNSLNSNHSDSFQNIFDYFKVNYDFSKVIYHADRSWIKESKNNLYEIIGFVLDSRSKPKDFYVDSNFYRHKNNTSLLQIFDSGSLKYIYKKETP